MRFWNTFMVNMWRSFRNLEAQLRKFQNFDIYKEKLLG